MTKLIAANAVAGGKVDKWVGGPLCTSDLCEYQHDRTPGHRHPRPHRRPPGPRPEDRRASDGLGPRRGDRDARDPAAPALNPGRRP
ncbi:hypothetical protein SGPA1_20454 [Streptomyces misionensis JCM 4497]